MSKLYKKTNEQTRWSSFENPFAKKGASAGENFGAKGHAFDKVRPGETVSLLNFAESAGIIRRIWITVSDRSQSMLRSLVLRCFWDGETKPAVEAPLGDFFSCGSELVKFENELFASPEGRSFNMYIPMPFKKSAKITLTNDSEKELSHLFYDVNFTVQSEPDEEAMYFHCYWNREKETVLGEDYTILPKFEGCGRFLGTAIVVNANPLYKKQWWGEGEVKAYIDGDCALPTLCGTGTEDYIGTGWGQGVYSGRYQGCLTADWDLRRWVFYRLHIADPIYFNKDFKFTIQTMGGAGAEEVRELIENKVPLIPVTCDDGVFLHMYKTDKKIPEKGWVNYYRSDDFASVAWFYLTTPANTLPSILPVQDR